MAAQETLAVVGIDIVHLRQANGPHVVNVQVEATTAAKGDVRFRPAAALRRYVRETNERAGEGREGIGVVLVLQTKEPKPNTVALTRTTSEVTTTVSQKAEVVSLGKIVSVGKVKATDDVRDFVAQVAIAVGV